MKQIVTPSLEEAKKRISNWRATRTKRRPIPDEVWDAVLPLIGQHSYSIISKELGLSYLQIKNKIEMIKEDPCTPKPSVLSPYHKKPLLFGKEQMPAKFPSRNLMEQLLRLSVPLST